MPNHWSMDFKLHNQDEPINLDLDDPLLSTFYLHPDECDAPLIEIPIQDLPEGSTIYNELGDPIGTYLQHH
jgi:hypothetical protein